MIDSIGSPPLRKNDNLTVYGLTSTDHLYKEPLWAFFDSHETFYGVEWSSQPWGEKVDDKDDVSQLALVLNLDETLQFG
uniref:Uncharacterized protein MANES_17G043100 n=1 Tax=Rhizophora mucronata TaxID=61149 RepID=A0A2P2LPT1_RHIMU